MDPKESDEDWIQVSKDNMQVVMKSCFFFLWS